MILADDLGQSNSLKWSDFTTTIARKAIIIGVVLVSMNQLTGVAAILAYTAYVFREAGSNLSPNLSAIVIGVILVIGVIISLSLVDRLGRKVVFIVQKFHIIL